MTIRTAIAAAPLEPGVPLLLLLHGFGSHERDLPGLAAALPDRFQWASLRAPIELSTGGAAWFPIAVPGNPEPETVRAPADAVLAWIDEHVDPSTPIVPVGFSQGGLMVTQLLRRRPARFVAGAVLSGFVHAGDEPGDAALAAARTPVFAGRGDQDGVITSEAFARADAFLPQHTALTHRVYPGLGHGISPEELSDLANWLDEVLPAV